MLLILFVMSLSLLLWSAVLLSMSQVDSIVEVIEVMEEK